MDAKTKIIITNIIRTIALIFVIYGCYKETGIYTAMLFVMVFIMFEMVTYWGKRLIDLVERRILNE